MSQTTALLIVGTTLLLGVGLLVGLIRPLRSGSYHHWSRPARWCFVGAVAAFGLFGAVLWIMLWWRRGGWMAGVGQFVILALGFRAYLTALPEPSASSAKPTPPPIS